MRCVVNLREFNFEKSFTMNMNAFKFEHLQIWQGANGEISFVFQPDFVNFVIIERKVPTVTRIMVSDEHITKI